MTRSYFQIYSSVSLFVISVLIADPTASQSGDDAPRKDLLDPMQVEDGWVGLSSTGDEYPVRRQSQESDWLEGSEGTGETEEFSETDSEFENLVALPTLGPWSGKIGPSVIIGNDDRTRVANTTRYPASAQVLIALPGGRCSGAMIGRDLVLTAGHCVHSGGTGGSWQTSASVYPGRNGRLSPFGRCNATRFYSVQGWTRDKNPAYDFGAIKLNCDIGDRSGWMGFFSQSATLVGKEATISSYPGDKPLEQWSHTDQVRSNTSLQTRYLTDTVGGNSGSGVFATAAVPSGCGGPCVHTAHAYGSNSGNSGTRITAPLFQNLIRWREDPK